MFGMADWILQMEAEGAYCKFTDKTILEKWCEQFLH